MKLRRFTLDRKHSLMSREEATIIEKEYNVYLEFNIDSQQWEMALVKD